MKKYHLSLLLIGLAFASLALAQPVGDTRNTPRSLFCPARLSDEVAVIDISTNQVITEIPVGSYPIRIAMTLDRRKAFISNAHSANISVLDTVERTNIATISVSTKPGESTITPDGRRLFVVHGVPEEEESASEPAASADAFQSDEWWRASSPASDWAEPVTDIICPVSIIDTATNLLITTAFIPGHSAKDILFTLDGRFAYIANPSLGEVDVMDTTTYQVTSVPTGSGSRRLCISPAGDRVYVTNWLDDSVSAIDTTTQQVIATIPVGLNARPMGIAITPNGEEVYTTNQYAGTVSVINTTTLNVVATIPTGAHCQRVVITRDGTKAFVQNGWSDTVSAIDTATHTVIATLPTGHHPWTILASPDDMKLYVCNGVDTTVTVIDIPSLTVSDTIADVGSHPFDLAFSR